MQCASVIVFVLLGLSYLPTIRAQRPSGRVINGTVAKIKDTKFQASIRLVLSDRPFGNGHMCGGSLIGDVKILTAAHCIYNANSKRFRRAREFLVVMGTLNRYQRDNNTFVSEVTSLAYMNTFSLATMRDDIALMFLKRSVAGDKVYPNIKPIVLAEEDPPIGAICQVSGWGVTEAGKLSATLLVAKVPIIPTAQCRRAYPNDLMDGMLCAGYWWGGTDSCQGDSGGPLVFDNLLVGVVSWGAGCAKPGSPGVYADVKYYRTWIETHNIGPRLHDSISYLILGVAISLSTLMRR